MAVAEAKVFLDHNSHTCLRVGHELMGVEVVRLAVHGLETQVIPLAEFSENWHPRDDDPIKAAKTYLAISENRSQNDPRAVEFLKKVIAADQAPVVAESDGVSADAARAAVAPGAVEPKVLAGPVDAEAPAAAPINSGASGVIPLAAVDAARGGEGESNFQPSKEKHMNVEPQNSGQPGAATRVAEGGAQLPVQPLAPVVALVAPPAAQPISEAHEDGDGEPAYAVHVNGASVTVEMNKVREKRLDTNAYDARPQTIVPVVEEPMFYVALDQNNVMARTASINAVDRKVIGALIGGWVAEGFTVTKASLKELAKHVTAARKVYEPKKEAEPASGAPAAA